MTTLGSISRTTLSEGFCLMLTMQVKKKPTSPLFALLNIIDPEQIWQTFFKIIYMHSKFSFGTGFFNF